MTIDDQEVIREVAAQSDLYEAALAANELDLLDSLFWDDARVVRYGAGENLYGIEAVRDFRKARPAGSARRENLRRAITSFGPDTAACHIEFAQHETGRRGRQTQLWVRIGGMWKIAAAHISLLPAPAKTMKQAG